MGCTMGKKQKGEEGGKEPPYGTKEPQEAPGEGTKETGENAAPEKDGEVAHLDAKVDLDPLLETQTEENAGQPTKPSVSEDIDPNTGSQPVHSTAAQDTEARGAGPDEEEPIPYVDSNVESATTRTTITKVSTTGTPEEGVTAESVTVTKTTVIKTSHTVEKNEDKPEESSLEPDKHKPVDNEVIVTKTTVTKTFERTEGDDKPTEIITTKTIDTHVEDKPKDTPATGEPEEPQPCHTSPPVVEYAEKPENEPVEAESCSRPEPIVEYAEKPESEPVEAEPSDTSPPVVESLEKPEAEPEAEPCYTKTTVVEIVEEKHEKPESEPVEAEPCVVSPPDVECLEETKPEAEPCYTKTTVVEIVEEKHEKSASEQVEAEPCDTSPPVVEAEPEAETSYTKTTVVEIVEEKPGTETRITTVDHEEDTPVDTGETAVPEEHASDAPDAPVVVSTGPEPIDLSSLPEGLAERLRAIDAAEAGDGVVRTTRTTVTTTRVLGGDGEVVGHTVTETEKKEVVQAGGEEQVVVESHTVTEEDISQPVAEDGGVDPAAQGAQSEDRFYNNKSFQKPDIDPSDSQQQDAALKIQTKYRQHHAKQEVQKKREEKAATTIQATYRGHTDRQKVKDIKEGEAAEEAAEEEKVEEPAEESKPEEEVDIDLADPDVQAAATKIQASFRGHKARQEVKELKEHAQPAEEAPATEEPKEEESTDKEVVDIDLNDPQVAAAATKIQAGVRGYMARKEVHKMKEEQGEAAPAEGQEAEGQEGEATDINLEDPEVIAAATKIQAAVRGHHARQEVQVMKDSLEEAVAESQEIPPAEKEEEVDVDLNDPAVNQAATKIQAGFRGYKARQEVQTLKDSKSPEGGAAEAPPEVTSEAPAAPEGNQPEAADEDKKEEVDIDLNDPEVAQAATKIQAAFKGHLVRKDMKDKEGKEETTADAPAEGEVTENKEGDQGEV